MKIVKANTLYRSGMERASNYMRNEFKEREYMTKSLLGSSMTGRPLEEGIPFYVFMHSIDFLPVIDFSTGKKIKLKTGVNGAPEHVYKKMFRFKKRANSGYYLNVPYSKDCIFPDYLFLKRQLPEPRYVNRSYLDWPEFDSVFNTVSHKEFIKAAEIINPMVSNGSRLSDIRPKITKAMEQRGFLVHRNENILDGRWKINGCMVRVYIKKDVEPLRLKECF